MAFVTVEHTNTAHSRAVHGILAALGASLLWGTIYIPYRKAYLSGLNPLSFVTVFTLGELGTMALLATTFGGGITRISAEFHTARHVVFWIFLGGFCWVIGDIFQQYATKYIGIGRGIPLSNTNQLWGLAWGALVFGELAHGERSGTLADDSGVVADDRERASCQLGGSSGAKKASARDAISRECSRYGLSLEECIAAELE